MELAKILENLDRISKQGIPLNVSAEKETLQNAGAYILGGFALGGLVAGIVIAIGFQLAKQK